MSRPMTLTQMIAEVYARLGEQSGFYTDAQITQWLNDGMDDVAIKLEPKTASATITTTNNTTEYAIPDAVVSVKTALYYDSANTTWRELQETGYLELFRSNPSWESDTVAKIPHMWYWKPEGYVGVYPKPVTGTTNGLRIIYSLRPTEMSSGSDTTTMPSYLDRTIVLYAVFRAKLKDRNDEKAVLAKAEWEESKASGAMIINKARKENIPRLEPDQQNYRKWWYNRTPNFRAISGS